MKTTKLFISLLFKETISNVYDSSLMNYTFTGTIHGYTGSTAAAYAERNSYTFKTLDAAETTTTAVSEDTTTTTTVSTAVSSFSESSFVSTAASTTAAVTTAAAPAKVTNIKLGDDGTVTWDAAENAAQYKVFKKIGTKAYYGDWTTKTSYKFSSVPTDEFEIYVAAKNSDGSKTYGRSVRLVRFE